MMNQTPNQMIQLGCESKEEFEEANALALVKIMALEVESKIQEESFWEESLIDQPVVGKQSEKIQDVFSNYVETKDPTEPIELGDGIISNTVLINKWLSLEEKAKLIAVLKSNKECFAWSYNELTGLSRDLVEHRLPIKPGFKPHIQPSRRMAPDVIAKCKDEVQRLLKAGFIRTARYVEWLSNIVPVLKKNGKLRVCIDFRDLNKATPKDEYPMPIVDMLVDSSAGHKYLSIMDGHSGYNQICIAEDDVHKTAFKGPGNIGTFEWIKMPFGLKNAGATYQRAMNTIFHDIVGSFLECYIDDIIVKSETMDDHLEHLKIAFRKMKHYKLKLNPEKCSFGVSVGHFLGFLIHQKGIQVDQNKAEAIITAKPPSSKKELQRFLGQLNFLRRFISNTAGKTKVFSSLLKLKDGDDFKWTEEHDIAFKAIKHYLINPPVLVPPVPGRPLKLYLAANHDSMGVLLAQDNEEGKEQAIYYLSRFLNSCECKYSAVEKLCLTLFFASKKLRHYMMPSTTYVICQTDVMKYMLSQPVLSGKIGKWVVSLIEFALEYVPQKSVKGQALADFLADHPSSNEIPEIAEIDVISVIPWKMWFDGSKTCQMAGIGIVLESPQGIKTKYGFQISEGNCSNNQAEYEALVIGLEILLSIGADTVEIFGDSQLVINQLNGTFKCLSPALIIYYDHVQKLAKQFMMISFTYVPRFLNEEANDIAQTASGYKYIDEKDLEFCQLTIRRSIPMLRYRKNDLEMDASKGENRFSCNLQQPLMFENFEIGESSSSSQNMDWRQPIIDYLTKPDAKADRATRLRSLNYVMYDNDLFKKGSDGLLLRCLNKVDAFRVMAEVHEGICGAHQAGVKMRWLIRRYLYYWPTILKDCIDYAKGCQPCQKVGPLKHVPIEELQYCVKPWPFRRWALDTIGMIYPPSDGGHKFILVGTDYFTKWVEAKALKVVNQTKIIKFIQEIINRFGTPQTLTVDNASVFEGRQLRAFTDSFGIRVTSATTYYPQANGQAESTNKIIKNGIQKMVERNPRDWHNLLSNVLWAYRTSKRTSTGTTPFALTYGHDAVLPMEVIVKSQRVVSQNDLDIGSYHQAMNMELEELDETRVKALNQILLQKARVVKSYNKKVTIRRFDVGDLVWKVILPLKEKRKGTSKWDPNWQGPFRVHRVIGKGAYHLSDLNGYVQRRKINGKFLKPYVPSIWESFHNR